jgi:hypothetical protein
VAVTDMLEVAVAALLAPLSRIKPTAAARHTFGTDESLAFFGASLRRWIGA